MTNVFSSILPPSGPPIEGQPGQPTAPPPAGGTPYPNAAPPSQNSAQPADTAPNAFSHLSQPQKGGSMLSGIGDAIGGAAQWAGDVGRTGIEAAADNASFGLASRGASYLRSGFEHLTGDPNARSPEQVYADIKQRETTDSIQHPFASMVGTVGGMLSGGLGIESGAAKLAGKGIPVLSTAAHAIQPVAGQNFRNLGRVAAVGAGMAATQQAAQEGKVDVPDMMLSGAVGAAAGPILSKVATPVAKGVARVLGGPADKGWAVLAKTMGMSPKDLSGAIDTMRQVLPGHEVSPAMVVANGDRAAVARLAAVNPYLAEHLQTYRDATMASTPQDVADLIQHYHGQAPGTPGTTEMGKAFGAQVPTGAQVGSEVSRLGDLSYSPLLDQKVTLTRPQLKMMFQDASMNAAKAISRSHIQGPGDKAALYDRLMKIKAKMEGPGGAIPAGATNSDLTVRDIDLLRQGMVVPDDKGMVSKAAKASADKIAKIGGPKYVAARQAYHANMNFSRGFEHGMGGKALQDIAPGDTQLRDTLATPHGRAGYAAGLNRGFMDKAFSNQAGAVGTAKGLAESAGPISNVAEATNPVHAANLQKTMGAKMESLKSVAGITPNDLPENKGLDWHDPAIAALEMVGGMHGVATARGGRWLNSIINSGRLTPSVEKAVTRALLSTDPAEQKAGFAAMERAGATQQQVRWLQQTLGAAMGAHLGATMATPTSVYLPQ